MKNYLRVDVENRSLVMDKTFAKNATIVGSDEYNKLQEARRDYNTFSVVQRHIKTNPNKECFNGLTYAYMEAYIQSHESSETLSVVLDEYKEQRLLASCHSRCHRYPTIKKWFLDKYPEVKAFGVVPLNDTDANEKASINILEMPLALEDKMAS